MSDKSDQKLLSGYPWLTEDLFKEIIEKDVENERISIEEFIVRPALKHGENYASQMIRVTLSYRLNNKSETELKEIRFVIKANHCNEDMLKLTAELKIFDKEIAMYQKVLPEAERLLASIGDHTKLAARCYAGSVENTYIIFEDLSLKNFKNTNRRHGLNLSHSKKVLEKLAKYHATTAYLLSKNYPVLEQFNTSPYNEDSDDVRKFTTICTDSVAEATKHLKGFDHFAKKLDKLKGSLFSKLCNAMKPDPNAFNVLTHGDLWANNIMFRSDENDDQSPTEALMVDFQICSVGSAVLDLAYMFFTSSHEDFQDREWDQLLQHYHQVLNDILIRLEYTGKIPTLTDIHVQFLRKAQCMMVLGILVQGIRRFEDADEKTNEIFFQDTEQHRNIRMKILTHPDMKKSLHFLLDYFDRKGLLDN